MIPTTTRYSPMKPSTSAQPALTPSNNKSIANQSPLHQRSGLTLDEAVFLKEKYEKIQGSTSLNSNLSHVLNELKGLLTRAQLYIHCLNQKGFFTQLPEQQKKIIDAFCQEKKIDPNTIEGPIDILQKITDEVNKGHLSQAEFIDAEGNLLGNHIFWGEFVKACEKSVRSVEEAIERLTPSP